MQTENPITFPCQFPIKIIGKTDPAFEGEVVTIVRKHVHDIPEGAFQLNTSKQGNYLAMTITITATSQTQLDAIYAELTKSPLVIMAL